MKHVTLILLSIITLQGFSQTQSMRMNMYIPTSTQFLNTDLVDGVLMEYKPIYSNKVDVYDAPKLMNRLENLEIVRDGKILAVERRQLILYNDTTFFQLIKKHQVGYIVEFIPANMISPNRIAWFIDGTRKLPISLIDITRISVNNDGSPISYYSIIYETPKARTPKLNPKL